jgi:PAS domain S-box-containing protein
MAPLRGLLYNLVFPMSPDLQNEMVSNSAEGMDKTGALKAGMAMGQLEHALRDSELSYRRLFESAKDGILILDALTGKIEDVNPFLYNLLGFTKADMVGKTIGELSPFKDVVSNQTIFEQLQLDRYVRYDDLPLEAKDGHLVQVEFVCNVYTAGNREVIQCNIRDITSRRTQEQQLTVLNACISKLNDIVLITDADPVAEPGPMIVFVNEAFERITGYTSAEALGRSPRFLQGEKTDRGTLSEIHEALAAQRPIRRELVNYRKDGSRYWVDVDIVPILDPDRRCTHFAAIERDVTEAKRKEARFRRLFDSSAQSVIFWNLRGEITDANDAFLNLLGYTREDLLVGLLNLLKLTPPGYESLDRQAQAELAAKGVCSPYEKEFIRKDGSRVPIILGAALLEDNPDDGVCFLIDLTERKKLEKQFLRAQRMESIGTLAGGIAHDLNNILAPILLSIEVLKSISGDSPQAMKVLKTIDVSARRGADIVRQVLSFARGAESERVEVQLKHLLHDLRTIVRDTFPRDIRLEFLIPNDTWTILADPTQVHQVLLNLFVNARDAMPNGGTLGVTTENCVLDDHYAAMNTQVKAGRYVRISVTDTGVGIAPAILDRIFEPFFTTKEINKSTGLGLSTVMAIIKGHDGIVHVYSEVGKGTTFHVYLPAIDVQCDPREQAKKDEGLPHGNGETILVVDDEASILAITSQTLLAFGYKVLTASDGADAVAVYAQNRKKISVVVSDIMMPTMGGLAMIRALNRIDPGVKIVTSSGLDSNGNIGEEFSANVRHFLAKPYTARALLETIRDTLLEY